ncbi:MAG: ATP-binding protein [Clostridia bacterium]|nr:ATP-binding protein [Clostridia bacterium]
MIRKLFRHMLVTQVLSAMTVMICMLIDSIMIGRFLAQDAMTAYGLASPVLMVFAAVGSMMTAGIQVICGRTVGSGDREGTNVCFSTSLIIAGTVSLVGLAVVFSLTGPIAQLLGADPGAGEVFKLTQEYLRGFIIGAPAFLLAQIMVPYMQLSGNQTRLIAAVGLMTFSDVLFDVLNVTVVKLDMLGMGLASSLSYYLALIVGGTVFLKKDCMFSFSFKRFKRKIAAQMFSYGVPTVINQAGLVLMVFIFNQILISVPNGKDAVAAYSVVSTVGNICYCFSAGIGAVALMLSSIFFTDEDRTSLFVLVKTMTRCSVITAVCVTAATAALSSPLAGLFIAGVSVRKDMAVLGLILFSLSLLPSTLNTALKNYFQGTNRIKITYMISLFQCFIFPTAFGFILSRFFAQNGVWLAFICGETCTLALAAATVWIRRKKISLSSETFAWLPDCFGASEDECREFTVRSSEDAIGASLKAGEFCRARGLSEREANLISLCIEETVVNIIEHGFTKDSKKHTVDVRLLFGDGKRLIRVRDDCVGFDPVDYMKLHEKDEDPFSHIGIRMVMKTVKDANYVNSLGLNNLTLVM